MNEEKIKKLIDNMRVKYRFLEKDLNRLEKCFEEKSSEEEKENE